MSANTGRIDFSEHLRQLILLFAVVIDLLTKGSRTEPMVASLIFALQLFKENRLDTVRSIPEKREVTTETPQKEDQSGPEWSESDKLRYSQAGDWARRLVHACVKEPALHRDNPALLCAAEHQFHHRAGHQCYWNNSFCIAVMCGMSWQDQRQAAWCVVNNGLNDYWEWTTHAGFETAAALKYLKIVSEDFQPPKVEGGYCTLEREIMERLVQHFNLPTNMFDSARQLSDNEERLRSHFRQNYPYANRL